VPSSRGCGNRVASGPRGTLASGRRFCGSDKFACLPDEERGGELFPLFFWLSAELIPLFFEKIPLLFRVAELLGKCL
jgi:hypothetical protein